MANIHYKQNGEYKDIVVKVGDTLPIGAEIDYEGSVVPDGWEEVDINYEITNLPTQSVGTNSYLLCKLNNMVYLNVNLIWKTSITANTFETWGNIPSALKPQTNIQCPAVVINGDTGNAMGYAYVRIDTDGNIKVRSNTAYAGSSVAGITFNMFWLV